jgi:hypothetical protein
LKIAKGTSQLRARNKEEEGVWNHKRCTMTMNWKHKGRMSSKSQEEHDHDQKLKLERMRGFKITRRPLWLGVGNTK